MRMQSDNTRKQGNASMVGSDLRGLLGRVERYLRLEATDKATVLGTGIVLGAVAFALVMSSIYFLGTGVVKSLTLLTGSEMASYYCVGGGLLLLVVLLFLCRKSLIEKPILRSLSKKLLEGEMLSERIASKQEEEVDLHELAKSLALEFDANAKDKKGGKK
ncbi:MAG: hypothetical protein J1F40_02795 [Prevotellaceae bacterium]|nr:hypothetical protein [Prevotellaceae bacterium]